MENEFYEKIPIGFLRMDEGSRILSANKNFYSMVGFTQKELVGHKFDALLFGESKALFKEKFPLFKATGEIKDEEFEILKKDKTRLVVSISSFVKLDENGKVASLECVLLDITQRKISEETMYQIGASLAESQRVARLGSWEWDLQTNEFSWSNEAFKMFGLTSEEFGGTFDSFLERVHPNDKNALRKAVNHALRAKKSFSFDHRIIRSDKTERFMHNQGEVMTDDKGKPVKMFGVIHDITERKRSEEKLRESEERLRSIFENAVDGILVADPQTRKFFMTNMMISKMLGYNQRELEEMKVDDIHPADELENVLDKFEQMSRGKITFIEALPVKKKDGSIFYADVNGFPVIFSGNPYIVGFFRDASYRRSQEEMMRKAREDLEIRVQKRTMELSKVNVALQEEINNRQKMENTLTESKESYRAVIDNIGIGVSVISPKMEILTLNKQMKKWFPDVDETKKSICYRSFNKPPREDICSYCPTDKTLKDGRVHEAITETPVGKKTINYRVISSPIKNREGRVIAAIEMVEDITGKKMAEEKLRKYHIKLSRLVQARTEELIVANKKLQETIFKLEKKDKRVRKKLHGMKALKKHAEYMKKEMARYKREMQKLEKKVTKRTK